MIIGKKDIGQKYYYVESIAIRGNNNVVAIHIVELKAVVASEYLYQRTMEFFGNLYGKYTYLFRTYTPESKDFAIHTLLDNPSIEDLKCLFLTFDEAMNYAKSISDEVYLGLSCLEDKSVL